MEVFGQCFHIDGCLSIEWDDTPDRTIYRPSIVLSFDISSIAITSSIDIERSQVSRYFDISSIEPALP